MLVRRKRAAVAAAAAGVLLACHARAGEIEADWSGNSGNWTDPTQWSTNPNYPNNGTPSGTTYDAVIDAPGTGPYTVTLNSDVTTNSVTIGSTNATLMQTSGFFQGGKLYNSGTFQVTNGASANITLGDNTDGTIEVDAGGTAAIRDNVSTTQLGSIINNGGTITFTGTLVNTGEAFDFGGSSGTWVLSGAVNGGTFGVLPGTILRSAGLENLTLASDVTTGNGLVEFEAVNGGGHAVNVTGDGGQLLVFASGTDDPSVTVTLSNVVVNLGGSTANAQGGYLYGSTHEGQAANPLFIDSRSVVQGWGTIGASPYGSEDAGITNAGVISANVSGKTLTILAGANGVTAALVNVGTLQAINGGILNISLDGDTHTVVNNGLLAIDSTSTMAFDTNLTLANGSVFDVVLGSNGNSGLLSAGDFLIQTNVDLNLSLAPGAVFSTPYEIVSCFGFRGAFAQVTPGFIVDYSHSGEILITAVPEPGACGLFAVGIMAALSRRRRSQSQTRT